MHKVKEIQIKRFRRLFDLQIEMRPLMVMIGANSVGKTSLLDAISLLSASAMEQLNHELHDLGGVTEVLTRGCADEILMGAKMDVENHEPLEYEFKIAPKGQSYSISQEFLTQKKRKHPKPFKHIESRYGDARYWDADKEKLVRPDWEYNPLESMLSQLPKMYRQPEELRQTLKSIAQYHVLDVSKRAPVKLPQQMKPANFPGENGEDLVSFLFSLRESNRDSYDTIEDTLKSAFPGFDSLSFPPVAAGMLSMTWKEKGYKDPIYIHQLSEGTLRFLWLISLLQSPALPSITMIDEPEVSLHPELLSLFAELIREASLKTQIIIATHSDRLIRFLKPEEIIVMDIDERGFTSAHWADSLAIDFDKWLKDYSLDEIWQMGIIGGRA